MPSLLRLTLNDATPELFVVTWHGLGLRGASSHPGCGRIDREGDGLIRHSVAPHVFRRDRHGERAGALGPTYRAAS